MAAPVLDERLAYGSLPNWVAHGLPVSDVWLPQTTMVNGVPAKYTTPMLPPIYAGRATKDTAPRLLEPRMKAHSLKVRSLDASLPWEAEPKMEPRQWSAYNPPTKTRDLVKLPQMLTSMEYEDDACNEATNNRVIEGIHSARSYSGGWRSNCYNQHAKQGFKFWLEEKKPFSKSSKYTFGSYRTFLGLGNAPRN
ncbi:uncharacterized protein LOC144453631 isoform X1 [Glandiceps talaboti]